jgi:predicted nucleotidyltransferase
MTVTSKQLSNPLDPKKVETLLRAAQLARQHGIPFLLVGAFARDVHLWHIHNIEITRRTADMDLSIQLPSWPAYHAFAETLGKADFKNPEPVTHPEKFLDSKTQQEIDLLPFGEISKDGKTIIWPDDRHPWSIIGFQDAFDHALNLEVEAGGTKESVRVAPLACIVLLKMVAISDRPEDRRKRDSVDIGFIIENYLRTGQKERLTGAGGGAIMASCNNDLQRAAAYLIGEDIRQQTQEAARVRCHELLTHEVESQSNCPLAQELSRELTGGNFQNARAVLAAMRAGLSATL